jgi:hypothetical protein
LTFHKPETLSHNDVRPSDQQPAHGSVTRASNVDDPEHQVVLTEVQDHTETIIIADILAVAINKSLIEVVEFGLCRSIT